MIASVYEYLQVSLPKLLLCEDEMQGKMLADVARFVGIKPFVLSDFRAKRGDDLRSYKEELTTLCRVLANYYEEKGKKILISPFQTTLHKMPSKACLEAIILDKNAPISQEGLALMLINSGYERVDIVQSPCEFSSRADIIDIFALNEDDPFRVLYFGNECESIRKFDVITQKSKPSELEKIKIIPFLARLDDEGYEDLQNECVNSDFDNIINDINSVGFWFIKGLQSLLDMPFAGVKSFDLEDDLEDKAKLKLINSKIIPPAKHFKDITYKFDKEIFKYHLSKKITIIAKDEALTRELDFDFSFFKSDLVLNLISENELIISLNKPSERVKKRRAKILVDELKKDDYVVHEDYGVARFEGLTQVKAAGALQDFVTLVYQNDDKLLLPVDKLYKIDKYIALNASIPSLDKLGKGTFIKMKEKLKQKLFVIASQILSLAAKRALIKAPKIDYDKALMQRYLDLAGFIYTKDQKTICKELIKDFASGKIMDRLISGDVGFGKTELACFGALMVLNAGLNVLFFVPTTLLSSQHYKNIKKRLSPFNIEVLKLDRFTSTKDKRTILASLESDNNTPKLVIGTHALLSVNVRNLGLIIIDEEHKFGVKQKEKLKAISKHSHLLSMSATPIPRSLNQALSQIKSYSKLTTPPRERQDVRTIFKEYEPKLTKEAIMRELRRGGQVFFIHNHIASIKSVKEELLRLIPTLKILILHSKIDSKESEIAMRDFEEKKYDLMLCTSIVESGIDLANVNTIIINNAQHFGIADLHQLRGRVGRSSVQGFCYLCIKDKEKLGKDALKRLLALESSSYLGSGEQLAYHDLEIRGGGNLLGVDQSGHIEQIGYSLYLKMLEAQLNAQSKKITHSKNTIDIKLNINAFLNKDLISEDRLRLELYRRLSLVSSVYEINEIEAEINDRFGKCDRFTLQYLQLLAIKVLANGRYKLISNYGSNIALKTFDEETKRLNAKSADDDDVLACLLEFLRKDKK